MFDFVQTYSKLLIMKYETKGEIKMKKEILKSSLYLCYITFSVVKAVLFIPYVVIKLNNAVLEQIKIEIDWVK